MRGERPFLPPPQSECMRPRRGSGSRVAAGDRAATRSALDAETGAATRAGADVPERSGGTKRACRRSRLRFNPLLSPIRFHGPNHPGGIASPDTPLAGSGCSGFPRRAARLAVTAGPVSRLAARSYPSTEDVLPRRRFTTGVSRAEGCGVRAVVAFLWPIPRLLTLCVCPRCYPRNQRLEQPQASSDPASPGEALTACRAPHPRSPVPPGLLAHARRPLRSRTTPGRQGGAGGTPVS